MRGGYKYPGVPDVKWLRISSETEWHEIEVLELLL